MKPTSDAVWIPSDEILASVVSLIRRDPVLGRGTYSSWEEVTPTDYEAKERARTLLDEGIVKLPEGRRDPRTIVLAFRELERQFWATDRN